MILIPGSLSFAKLVMMSSAPAKSAGDARYASQDPFIHLLIVPFNLDSKRNKTKEHVLSMLKAISFLSHAHTYI